jgi:hypothetical protein
MKLWREFFSAIPNFEVEGEKAGQTEQLMRGSGGEDSNLVEVGTFHAKICSMSGTCFLSPPQASASLKELSAPALQPVASPS